MSDIYSPLGQDILNLVGVDDELKNVLIELLERLEETEQFLILAKNADNANGMYDYICQALAGLEKK